ncbi:MAG TPA: glycoside hydrolase, partial [Flavobacterium sp.]|nr:glycoside hydrolase [Flavobacterium sp.]
KSKDYNAILSKKRNLHDVRIYEVLSLYEEKTIGIDVSQYQGIIDWENVGKIDDNFDIDFVIIRATAGSDKVDTQFYTNWENTKSNFIRGAYHYFRPDENSMLQAANFIKTVHLSKGDLPPVLDIEQLPQSQSIDKLKIGLKRWLDKIEQHYGVKPIIYSGERFYTDFLKEDFSDYKFWIANYNFWRKEMDDNWILWQFTEKARVTGINELVDVNVYKGLKAELIEHGVQ